MVYLQCWHGWCYMKLLPSRRILCTPYNHAPCHFMQSHICKVLAYLSVTCHLYFWQNDRGLVRATVVTLSTLAYTLVTNNCVAGAGGGGGGGGGRGLRMSTPSLPCYHLKMANKSAKLETLSLFVFFFALACERTFIKAHSIESRCTIGPENVLFVGTPCIFQRGNLTGWGSEGLKPSQATIKAVLCFACCVLSQ